MKLHVKLYLKNAFFLALLILTSSLWGQGGTFPVQVIPQVTPPPPIYLSNYADASTLNSPLRVQIILNDLNIQNREVRLKTYFQGSGLSFQSNDFVTGSTSLFLEGGVPIVLTNVELAPYFKFENITGISPNVYGNAIPEGTYQICFEVYDLATGNRLSSKSCATTVVFQNEPPFLISPRNKTNVAETNPQNIVFQWTPRSINVTNVEYEISLVEIWDTQIDPQAAFLSSPPILQTTTSATTYVFGPSDPLLLSGKNYAWRIQAKAKQGTQEIGLFKNQGYSEIFSFSHASACDLPLGINHEVKGSTNANIFWDDFSTDVPEYTVRYRKKSSSNSSQAGGSEWFFNKTTSNTTSLWDLKAGTTYEYQLQKKCAVTKSEWSIAKQFTTHIADNEESVYECGITPDFSLNNTDPIDALVKGDKFTAGDFPINVLEVSGSKGRFTGKGYVTIPYLNSIRVGVQFTNVLINTDKQLAEGTVITLYDPSLKNILDVDDAIETVGNVAEAVGELFEGDNDLDEIHVNWDIDPDKDIKIEDGVLIITNPANGATETSPLGDDKVIVDKSGQTYHIDAGGKITKGEKIDPSGGVTNGNVTGVSNKGEIESLTAEGIQVTFESTGIYGFDQKPDIDNDKLNKEYTTIPDAEGGKYTLPHIAIEKEQTIVVTAKVELSSNSEYSLEDLKFKTKVGELIHISAINEDNNSIELEVSGHYTLENETIYAVVPNKQDSTKQLTAGAFTLWHLTDRVVNVVLVSIDKAPLPDTAEIARIFKKGGSTFNFETTTASLKGTNLLGDDDRLQIADNAWLNAYNDEQNSVINHIKSQIEDGFDDDKYYVLIFNTDFKTSRSIAGFMPLQRQFGFVFNGALATGEESKGDLIAVTAHELGHGVFALQHPFTEYGTEEKATDWLMDYKDGAIDLNHMNWAQMHNPALKFYVFQDEEDGEYEPWKYLSSTNILASIPENLNDVTIAGASFISRGGIIFSLPQNTKDITFFDNGTLYAFTIEGIRYVSCTDSTTETKFKGYSEDCGKVEDYKDNISQNLDFSTTIKTYYAKANNEDCAEISIFEGAYTGAPISSTNDGISASTNSFKTFEDVVSNISQKETIKTGLFSCLKNKDLKTIYKYVEYKFPDYKNLDSLFTRLNKLNNVSLSGFLADSIPNIQKQTFNVKFNIAEENSVIFFKESLDNYLKGKSDSEISDINLKIDLTINGRDLFDISTGKDILNCVLNWDNSFQPENSFLPACIWYNVETDFKYAIIDPAFQIGIADGGIITVTDIAKLIDSGINISQAYTFGLILLPEDELENEITRLSEVLAKIQANVSVQSVKAIDPTEITTYLMNLKASKGAFDIYQNIQSSFAKSSASFAVKQLLDILKTENPEKFESWQDWIKTNDIKVIAEITQNQQLVRDNFIKGLEFLELLTNPAHNAVRDQLLVTIVDEIDTYFTTINETNSVARYYQGKIAFQVISEVAIALSTSGGGNIATLLSKAGNLSTKTIRLSTKIALKKFKKIGRLSFRKNGDLLLDDDVIAKILGNESLELNIEKLPNTININETQKLDEILDTDYILTDKTEGSGKLTFVEKDGVKYVAVDDVSGLANSVDEISSILRSKIINSLPTNKADDLIAELSSNSALKTAMEADEISSLAWKRIDDGIPSFRTDAPNDYLTCLKKMSQYEKGIGGSGNVKYYRVQDGGSGNATSRELLTIEPNGNMSFADKTKELYFSTDNLDHASYYVHGQGTNINGKALNKTPANRPNGEIIEFEVPKWLDDKLKQEAIPQYKSGLNTLNDNSPQIVDYNQPGNPFGIKMSWQTLIEENYIKGSVKIVE
ncbi:fibronectin type III domain-containing protein [Cellulophaga baltica]|uniref:fibronectin type III domain-containing protein n=1 Tax=Cellulophaga baltica TaxID=76594 RepID=UPI00040E4E56|nr:fibronectin type III domain-containing protein [Cellulophaga baltica]